MYIYIHIIYTYNYTLYNPPSHHLFLHLIHQNTKHAPISRLLPCWRLPRLPLFEAAGRVQQNETMTECGFQRSGQQRGKGTDAVAHQHLKKVIRWRNLSGKKGKGKSCLSKKTLWGAPKKIGPLWRRWYNPGINVVNWFRGLNHWSFWGRIPLHPPVRVSVVWPLYLSVILWPVILSYNVVIRPMLSGSRRGSQKKILWQFDMRIKLLHTKRKSCSQDFTKIHLPAVPWPAETPNATNCKVIMKNISWESKSRRANRFNTPMIWFLYAFTCFKAHPAQMAYRKQISFWVPLGNSSTPLQRMTPSDCWTTSNLC